MPPALILADDATGALECASLLAAFDQQSVQVIDTQSRHLPPAGAANIIRQYAHTPHLYKKTDSALRGNIAPELLALLPRPVVYIPAYPNLGRTVHNGHLFIHSTPIHQTDFARDPRHPVTNSDIAQLFPSVIKIPNPATLPAHWHQPAILLCDAATNDDLLHYAQILALAPHTPVLASPAGFIPYWAQLLRLPQVPPPSTPKPATWLVVCGSRHPQSLRQAAHARHLDIPVIQSPESPQSDPEQVALQLAQTAQSYIDTRHPGGVFILGGDTVFALWRALGVDDIRPLPELRPGIAASWSPARKILFVTKAGAFGSDTLIEEIIRP